MDLEVAGSGPLAAVCPVPPIVSCHIMHSFQPCVSNRIVVLLLIIQQLHSVLIVILTCINLIV